jgi:RND family efflux transporter MFP subunit
MRIGCVGLACSIALSLVACGRQKTTASARPVRAVMVRLNSRGEPVTLTGQVRAASQENLSFRLAGRLIERSVNVGDQVHAGQIIARLDPQNQENALQSARASVLAAKGQQVQAKGTLERQRALLARGFTSRAQYDQAVQVYQTALSQVDSTEAQLRIAQDQLRYDDLRADSDGVIIAKAAEPGEVVQPGQMIVQLARRGGVDAVFDVPAILIRTAPRDPMVEVALADDPAVHTIGRVREVAPQADPATRTFEVKVGLISPPDTMRLGTTVTGQIHMSAEAGFTIPASALTETRGQPAVWIVNPATRKVALRQVRVERYDQNSVLISRGLEDRDIIVTAGVQALHPDQQVVLLRTTQ